MGSIRRGVLGLTTTLACLTALAPTAQAVPARTRGVASMTAPGSWSCQFYNDLSCQATSDNASFSPDPAQPGQAVTFTADDSWAQTFINHPSTPCPSPGTEESDLDPADFPTFPLARVGDKGFLFDNGDPLSQQLDLPATVSGHDVDTSEWSFCGNDPHETFTTRERVSATFTAPAAGCYQAVAPVSLEDQGAPSGTHFAGFETTGSVATLQVGERSCLPTTHLTVVKAGDGNGSVTLGNVDCPLPCTKDYSTTDGATVHLRAQPALGSFLDHWEGACTGAALTCSVQMSADRQVTAVFARRTRRLTMSLQGTGRVSGPGIQCRHLCTRDYAKGTVAVLLATPISGRIFDHWADGAAACGSQPTCMLTMNTDLTATAVFVICGRTLHLVISGAFPDPPNGMPCVRTSHTRAMKGAPAWPRRMRARVRAAHRCEYTPAAQFGDASAAYDEVSSRSRDGKADASTYARCTRSVPPDAMTPKTLRAYYGFSRAHGRPHWGLKGHLPKTHRPGPATDFLKLFVNDETVLDPSARRGWRASALRAHYSPMIDVAATGSSAADTAAAAAALCAGGPNGVHYKDGDGYLGLWAGSSGRANANAPSLYAALSACTHTFLVTS